MKKIKDFLSKNKDILIVFFIILFTIMLPYMQNDFIIGDDYEYHFSRIQSIKEALEEGIFPVKVHPKLANGYGYGSGLFYPNLFLYIPAILCLMGLNFFVSYKIFIAIMLLLMFVLTYKSLKSIVEDKTTTLIGVAVIMLSSCLSLHLLKRVALGEFLGFIFIAPVIAGIHDYIHNDFKKPWLLFIGFFGLINSHLITTAICTVYCVIVFLFNIKTSLKNPKKMLKLFFVAVLVALTTAYFWMPMLEQMIGYKFKYSNQWTTAKDNVFGAYDLFGPQKYSLGILITICFPMIIVGMFDKKVSKKAKIFSLMFLILVIIMLCPAIWNWTDFITGGIQFKWRLLGITTVLAGISISMLLKEYCENNNVNPKYILIIFVALSMFIFNFQYTDLDTAPESFVESKMYSLWNSIGGGCEYLPLEMNVGNLGYPQFAIADDGEKILCNKTFGRIEFEKTDSKQNIINPPLIYYYGYVADITDENGVVSALEVKKADTGLVEIITEGKHGNIRVWYNGTKIQKISYLLSIGFIGIIVLAIVVVYVKRKFVNIKNINKK